MRMLAICLLIAAIQQRASGEEPKATDALKPSKILTGVIKPRERIEIRNNGPVRTLSADAQASFIDSKETFAILWKNLDRDDKMPEIDFKKDGLVIILATATDVNIVSDKGQKALSFSIQKAKEMGTEYTLAIFPIADVRAINKLRPKSEDKKKP